MKYLVSFFSYLPAIYTRFCTGKKLNRSENKVSISKELSDSGLLDLVQKQTIRYFWDFAHPVSGMARERSNESFYYGGEVVTTGGTGFVFMALITGVERKWLTREIVYNAKIIRIILLNK